MKTLEKSGELEQKLNYVFQQQARKLEDRLQK